MKVKIEYFDHHSLLKEEIAENAKRLFGNSAYVETYPETNNSEDMLYYAIHQLITAEQLNLLYDSSTAYNISIKKLRAEILSKMEEILNQVIIDNETKAV